MYKVIKALNVGDAIETLEVIASFPGTADRDKAQALARTLRKHNNKPQITYEVISPSGRLMSYVE